MMKSYLIWLRVLTVSCAAIFGAAALYLAWWMKIIPHWQIGVITVLLALCLVPFYKLSAPLTKEKFVTFFDCEAQAQHDFLLRLPEKHLVKAIFASAALSLMLELSVIRWQSSSIDFLAFFKNFGLIACFAGLGLGYSLSNAPKIPVGCTSILLGCQVCIVTLMQRLGITLLISKPPVVEQVSIRVSEQSDITYWLAVYVILVFVFCITSLAFIPIGQLCGGLMGRVYALKAYGTNLLGSLFGVLLMALLGCFWSPPVLWIGICLLACIFFSAYNGRSILIGASISMLTLMVLACPMKFAGGIVHSPYQVIELNVGDRGWGRIEAAGYYYQRVLDLSQKILEAYPELTRTAAYYNLPYRIAPAPKNVLILGSGAGNDVAAALRAGAEHIDAVEIDPAIAEFGRIYHPEKPYQDKRVNLILDDGRAFLRHTQSKYDVIVYALIDSHALSSSGSSLRVDSYIYTLESFASARQHLQPHGLLALSFVGVVPELQRKVFLMLKTVFDNRDPETLCSGYDTSTSFFEMADGSAIPAAIESEASLRKRQDLGSGTVPVDLSTDDWPFFYMPHRQFPLSYLPLIALVLTFAVALVKSLNKSRLRLSYLSFFWLGVGFMLVETKAITELGLQFGNTWLVTAIVVASVIFMAFISNVAVERLKLKNLVIPAILLIASLVVSAIASKTGIAGLSSNQWGMTAILTCPIIFSGILFSILISKVEDIGSAMAMNILGALCGGVLEYNAMYLGYRALYFFAIMIYLACFVSVYTSRKTPATSG